MNLDVDPGFGGVVSVSRGDTVEFERPYGLADRAHAVPATIDTQFAIASGSKAFTDGAWPVARRLREMLGTC